MICITAKLQRHPRLLEYTVMFALVAPNLVYRCAEICMHKCLCTATDLHSMHKIIAHTYRISSIRCRGYYSRAASISLGYIQA